MAKVPQMPTMEEFERSYQERVSKHNAAQERTAEEIRLSLEEHGRKLEKLFGDQTVTGNKVSSSDKEEAVMPELPRKWIVLAVAIFFTSSPFIITYLIIPFLKH